MAARARPSPHIRQANWLFARLALLVVVVALVNGLFGPLVLDLILADGLVGALAPLAALLAANLVALWLAIHLVFTALDGVVSERLEATADAP